jgi:hypothetical protein
LYLYIKFTKQKKKLTPVPGLKDQGLQLSSSATLLLNYAGASTL